MTDRHSDDLPVVDAPGTVPAASFSDSDAKSRGGIWESQLFRFILVGGFSAIVDFGSTSLFTWVLGLPDGVAKTLGFVLGTLTAYLINRRWTFQAEPSFSRFVITMFTYGLTYLVQVGLYLVSIPQLQELGLNDFWVRLISFVIAQGTATVLNFLIQKFLIFRK